MDRPAGRERRATFFVPALPTPPRSAVSGPLCLDRLSGNRTLGHPVASTLDAIAAAGSAIWRTDLHGTITVAFEGGVPAVVADR